ncbi:MAG: hypothetical protein VKQ33_12185 [Candidatus Sericytochromatia bacterium]|nr:hypothetical protein [Candidatus Sericytochromatia bacterium]
MPAGSGTCLLGLPGAPLRLALQARYEGLLARGVPTDRILVLVEARSRAAWQGLLLAHDAPTGAHRLHTPTAWMQHELALWWPLVAERLAALGYGASAAEPAFVQIDLSQHLLDHFAASRRDEEGRLVTGSQGLPRFQAIQILDALARGIEHGASLLGPGTAPAWRADVGWEREAPVSPASLTLAGEIVRRLEAAALPAQRLQAFPAQVGAAVALYVEGMLRHRLLDHALSLEAFAALLWPEDAWQRHFHAHTSHVLVEALDEAPPRVQALCQALAEAGVDVTCGVRGDLSGRAVHPYRGGLREYVGAAPAGAWALAEAWPAEPVTGPEPPLADLGRALRDGLLGAPRPLAVPPGAVSLTLDHMAPTDMVEAVVADLGRVLETTPPSRTAIVTPAISPLLVWTLRTRLEALGWPLYVFAGTNRLSDYRPVRLLLTLARLGHPAWGLPPSRFELLELLEAVTGLDPLRLGRVAQRLLTEGGLASEEVLAETLPGLDAAHLGRYRLLLGWLAEARERAEAGLEAFLEDAFARIYVPFRAGAPGGLRPDEVWLREVSQIGQLVELAARFEAVDGRLRGGAREGWGRRFLAFLAANPIAERPFFQREPHGGSVMLTTASQLAEQGFVGPDEALSHLFLIDAGSSRWLKSDRRELTNPRVLAAGYPGGPYSPERDATDTREKLGRVMMALCLKVEERLWVHGCLVDEEGQDNTGPLPDLLGAILLGPDGGGL